MKVIHELKACDALKTFMGILVPFTVEIEKYGLKC